MIIRMEHQLKIYRPLQLQIENRQNVTQKYFDHRI